MKNRESKSYRATDRLSKSALALLRKRSNDFEKAYFAYLGRPISDIPNDEPDHSDYGLTGEQAHRIKRICIAMIKEVAIG